MAWPKKTGLTPKPAIPVTRNALAKSPKPLSVSSKPLNPRHRYGKKKQF